MSDIGFSGAGFPLSPDQELIILRQDVRNAIEAQRVLGGVLETLMEADDEKTQQIRRLESEKAALLAANEELQQALRRIVLECGR